MTAARTFNPTATPRRQTGAGPDQPLTIRRGDTPTTITIRQAGHTDWDTICNHWNPITQTADTNNLPNITTNVGPERGGTTSMTDLQEHHDTRKQQQAALEWCREKDRLVAELTRLAQRAPTINTPAAKPSKDKLPRCVKCDQDIDPDSPDGKAHTVNLHPLHANTCYHQVWRQATTEGVDMAVIVNLLAQGIRR